MAGNGLKKLGEENGLKVVSGSVCGDYKGYFVRMNEGAGYKKIDFCFTVENSENQYKINEFVGEVQKKYLINAYTQTLTGVAIVFSDTFGTMTRIKDFLQEFIPVLDNYKAKGVKYCAVCGNTIEGSPFYQFRGDTTYYGHQSCMQKDTQENDHELPVEDNKTYVKGVIGSFLGMIIGVIPMIILAQMGWYAGLAGLLLGIIIKKGYEILGGKFGKGKLVTIITFAFIGVFFATFCNFAIATYGYFMEENYSPSFIELITGTIKIMFHPDNQAILIENLGLGFLFTGLGCFSVFKQVNNEIQVQNTTAQVREL
ncbi:MAG: hypothetical protein A2Y17_08620 [Clostridiales bacterium GWF2_38_85]|nr:MAG: hypothetical protein A2Y17_08620 [Clostridiales bacterium GWF2_38_85]HBL83742.1 hypothetical protein [Clostridiales bacterium]